MPASRIIITGKNSAFPKTVRMPIGLGVDGNPVTVRVQIRADECLCKKCGGLGYVLVWDGNPSHRETAEPCANCDEGIAKVAVA